MSCCASVPATHIATAQVAPASRLVVKSGVLIANAIKGSELTITCRGDSKGLHVTGRAPIAEGVGAEGPDELSEQVLNAVADSPAFTTDGTEVQFTLFRGHRPTES